MVRVCSGSFEYLEGRMGLLFVESPVVVFNGFPHRRDTQVVAVRQQVCRYQTVGSVTDHEIGPFPDKIVVIGIWDLGMGH